MDPVSFVFAAYMDAVQNTVHAQVADTLGTEVKAVVIDYQGVEVPFQYQIWRVRDQQRLLVLPTRFSSILPMHGHGQESLFHSSVRPAIPKAQCSLAIYQNQEYVLQCGGVV